MMWVREMFSPRRPEEYDGFDVEVSQDGHDFLILLRYYRNGISYYPPMERLSFNIAKIRSDAERMFR